MIKLNTLSLSHFMCIESAAFDFSKNYITVFAGPNASGKSTIFESIALCWTERRRGDSFKDFIMHGHESASISHTATINGEPIEFNVEIVDKRGATPFQRTIHYKNQTYTNSECTTLLSSLDIDYLQHIMFSMQGENNITDLRPAERAKLLKRIFNFEFQPQLIQLDALIEQENQNMLILKTQYEMLSHMKFDYTDEAPELSPAKILEIDTRLEEIADLLKVANQRALLQEETVKRLNNIKASQSITLSRKRTTEDTIKGLNASIVSTQRDKATTTTALVALVNPDDLQKEIDQKQQLIVSLQSLVLQNKSLLTDKETTLQNWQSSSLELSTHISAHKQGRCPQCGQDTHPEAVPDLEDRLAKITEQYNILHAQKIQLDIDTKVAERNIMQCQSDIPTLQERIKQTIAIKSQYQKILKSNEDNLLQANSSLISQQQALRDLDTQLADITSQIIEVSPQLQEIDTTELCTEQSTLATILQNNNTTKAQNIIVRRQNTETKVQEEKNKKTLEDLNKKQNNILLSVTTYRDAKKILEVDLPNYIIVKACSKLEKHINTFITNVMPGMVVRLFQTRSGVEFCYSPNGAAIDLDDWTSTKMASGFEREVLSAAWRVAIARAYKLTALMLDEVDSAASTISSEKMFRELANITGFDQLFIVSHKTEIIDILLQENDRITAYFASEGTFTRQEY